MKLLEDSMEKIAEVTLRCQHFAFVLHRQNVFRLQGAHQGPDPDLEVFQGTTNSDSKVVVLVGRVAFHTVTTC